MDSSLPRIRLIHFDPAGFAAKAALLQAGGYAVEVEPMSATLLRALRQSPPAAVVIDLDRQPSSGRDLALNLRQYKSTRGVPLVIAGGDPDKVAAIRALLPDIVHAPWSDAAAAVGRALAQPSPQPAVARSLFAAYAGVPLARKLGIDAGYVVALVGAPDELEAALGTLPQGVQLTREPGGARDLTLWFVRSGEALTTGVAAMAPHAERGRLWILWPKKASGVATDLSQSVVRRLGVAGGLMDYKMCSFDDTWTGLRFTHGKPKRTRP